MGNIAASDVTARIRSYSDTLTFEAGQAQRMVVAEITVDFTTNDVYVVAGVDGTGTGIPLTNLFTSGNASDLGIDPKYPVYCAGGYLVDGGTTANPPVFNARNKKLDVVFVNAADTAAGKKLALFPLTVNAAELASAEVTGGADLNSANYLNSGGNAAGTAKCTLTFYGRKRL